MQLHRPEVLTELTALEAHLLVISFAPLEHLRLWVPHFQENFLEPWYAEHAQPWPADLFARTRFLTDPNLAAYHAYGLGRNSVVKVYGPGILWQYVRWGIQGKPIHKPTEDPLQRGGDFVVDRAGQLTLAHLGRDQADRPPIADILGALGRLAPDAQNKAILPSESP